MVYSVSFHRGDTIVLPFTAEELEESIREHRRAQMKTWKRIITEKHALDLVDEGKAELQESTLNIDGHKYGRLFRFDMLREDIFLLSKRE